MYQKTLSMFIALVALLCIGYGTTGFYLMDFDGVICASDSECTEGSCCDVGDYGVCALDCEAIENAVGESTGQISSWEEGEFYSNTREVTLDAISQNYIALSLGLILLLIILIIAYIEWKEEKGKKKKVKKKVSKKKVKRKVKKK
tara:strand:+ start:750 stop:1184 length:435 start_codon:yes stop_codon:yes gene_type:complete